MDKHTAAAFEKLEKCEHILHVLRERRGCGRITHAQFREEERAVLTKYALTEEEKSAYEFHCKVTEQRKRRAK